MFTRPSLPSLPLIALLAAGAIATATNAQDMTDPMFLPGDADIAASVDAQEVPNLTPGGPVFLAVWQDARTSFAYMAAFGGGPYFEALNGNMRDIYAAVLDPDGNPITNPIVITNASYNQVRPKVAWNGENWLVTWMSERQAYFYVDILAARVSPEGVVLDDPPILIRDGAESQDDPYDPVVASDGDGWVVAWEEFIGLVRGLRGARVTADGEALDSGGKILRQDSNNTYADEVAIAFASDEYLLIWTEGYEPRKVVGQRFDTALDEIDALPFTINMAAESNAQRPCVATNGTKFFVAWHEEWDYVWKQLYGARVKHNGDVQDTTGIMIEDFQAYVAFDPCVAWDGAQWWVAYNGEADVFFDDIYARRIAADGTLIDETPIVVADDPEMQYEPTIAPKAGGGIHALWKDDRASGFGTFDVYAASVSPDGVPATATPLSTGLPRQSQTRFATYDGIHTGVFLSEVSGVSRVLLQRVTAAGVPIDAEPLLIDEEPLQNALRSPAIAWNGSLYLIAWHANGVIVGQRFDADVSPIDPAPFTVMQTGTMCDVAALGGDFLVVAPRIFSGDQSLLKGARVRGSDGAVLDATPFWIGGDYAVSPRVDVLGDRWFVVWEHHPSHDVFASTTKGAFVTAGGSVTPEFSISGSGYGENPDLAINADQALVVFSDQASYQNAKLDGRLVNADGSFDGSEFLISDAAGHQYFPTVAFDGEQFVAAWADYRNVAYLDQLRADIYAARISAAGEVLDPDGFAAASGPLSEDLPELAGWNGFTVMSYSALNGMDDVPEVPRLAVRVLGVAPGDLDRNGVLDGADVAILVDVLLGADTDPLHVSDADMNDDGAADGDDIQVFLGYLLS